MVMMSSEIQIDKIKFMKERIIRLVRILASPNKELVIDIIISKDIILNSIEVLDDDFRINVWLDDMEFQYDSG